MKKIFFALGLMAAAFTLTNCAKQETAIKDAQPAKAGVPFSFNVGIDTKTEATDAGVVTWKKNDALNVFHAVANTSDYGSNDKFTLSSGTSFTGDLKDGALTADAYDWYVIYPYDSHVATPASTSTGYLTVGSAASGTQTQVGASNKAHLAGSKIPLYGVAKGVKKGEALSMTLNQLVSVVKIRVKNSTAAELPVSSVSFKAPVDVVGTYYLDITGAEVVYTPSGATYVSNTANLAVSDATIAAGATEDFYIAIKPFSASSGDIDVTVNGYKKSFTLSSEKVFAQGKVKSIDFDYDNVGPTPAYTLSGSITGGSNGYATASTITQNEVTWSATGNTTIAPWRIGGKSLNGVDRAIYSSTPIAENITKIEVASGTSSLTVNSLTISVHNNADDAANGNNAIASKIESNSDNIVDNTVTFTKADATSWAGKYYRIVYNVSNSETSNYYVQFISAKFYD